MSLVGDAMVRAPVDTNHSRGRLRKPEEIMIRSDRRHGCSGRAVDQQIGGSTLVTASLNNTSIWTDSRTVAVAGGLLAVRNGG